ncbi:hypothetical protein C2E20_8258 [Micractinium conductrix]|uniref:Uncharacterized protein n=1 Tax=Micractinium conductrix TaxID=554055 RepID=A0A2P6V211_9CHLO|nr:hypothetical protein C2E20_8258 [Micractinium conductrix]|eukprot:PSC68122.1 hypothetical protein C2E20_8258 [Micractinium conductrix]
MRATRAVALLLCLACAGGARATIADGAIADAVSQAMNKVLQNNPLAGLSTTATAVGQGLSTTVGALTAAYASAGAQAEAALAAYEKEYCTPATFTPSEKVPAIFTGKGLSLDFSLGECTFDEHKWIHEDVKELDCTEPSITLTKTPANFTSKFRSAPEFTSKECKIEKVFGQEVEQVLFVFDGSSVPDVTQLTAKINEEVKKVLGTVGTGVGDIVGNAKSMLMGGLLGGADAAAAVPAAVATGAQAFTYTR